MEGMLPLVTKVPRGGEGLAGMLGNFHCAVLGEFTISRVIINPGEPCSCAERI